MNLTGQQIKDTYEGLLNIGATGLTGALQTITDGLGNPLPMQVSSTTVNFTGCVTGIVGTTGPAGATGAQGPIGPTGPAGSGGGGATGALQTDNAISSTLQTVKDSLGNSSALSISCKQAILGGCNNTLQNTNCGDVIIGGGSNSINSGKNNVIVGSNLSSICSPNPGTESHVIIGGSNNLLASANNTQIIIGGQGNSLTTGAKQNTIIGGSTNQIICGSDGSGDANTLIGGCALTINGNSYNGGMLGGCNNTMNGVGYSTLLGGINNVMNGGAGNGLLAGSSNTMGGVWGVLLGGVLNCIGNGYAVGMLGGFGNKYSAGNEGGQAMIGGFYNCLFADSGKGPIIIGGESNYYLNSTGLGGGYSYSWGGIFAGFSNQIRGTAPSTSGANVNPIIIGGQSNIICGDGTCANTTSQAAIINSFSSYITNSTLGTIIGGTGNNINGFSNVVILGGQSISADANNTTYVSNLIAEGQAASRAYSLGVTGTNVAIDWNNSNIQTMTLNGSGTVAMSNPIDGGVYTLQITQGTGGGHTLIWSNVKWPGGAPPSLSITAGAVDILTFIYGPTAYFGNANLNFS